MSFIPVNVPLLVGNEKRYLEECIDSGWISSEGPFVERFEQGIAERVERKHAVAVTSGTAALDVAVEALGIRSGDEVIVPTFAIISCINQVLRSGAKPIFVDCDRATWNMDVSAIAEKISDRTKAIMVVHTYGLPVDLDPILALAERHGLKVIEDAAEMLGQTYRDRPCGSFGDISIFSFYPNKHVTSGEGGMVLTDDSDLAERCRALRNLCFRPDRRFVHDQLGWNYRMTNLQAAVGLAQLEQLDMFVRRKREIGALYSELLAGESSLQLPLESTEYAENIYWVYGVVLAEDIAKNARELMSDLSHKGVGSRPFFYPLHKQPVLSDFWEDPSESLPVSEYVAEKGFYVPSGLALTNAEIELVVDALRSVL